jgi:hypothetical protein
MKRIFIWIAQVVAFGQLCSIGQTGAPADSHNNSDAYVTAMYDLSLSRSADWPRLKGEIRDFLWSHWHKNWPGKITVTTYTKEGVPTRSTYIIDRDNRGRPVIKLSVMQELGINSRPASKSDFTAYTVERFVRRGKFHLERLADESTRRGDGYVLVMKDIRGEIVDQW